MSTKVSEYIVVSHRGYECYSDTIMRELSIKVNEYLKKGWILRGEISMQVTSDGNSSKLIVAQAMTKNTVVPKQSLEEDQIEDKLVGDILS